VRAIPRAMPVPLGWTSHPSPLRLRQARAALTLRRERGVAGGCGGAVRSARGARIRLYRRAVKPARMVKLDLDRRADATRFDRAVEDSPVARSDVSGCGTCGLARLRIREHADHVYARARHIERVRSYGLDACDVCIRNDRGGRLDRGLARVLRARVLQHAVLDRAQ